MIIVITDACFLIDLIDIDLFEEFLGLGYQVHIASSVFAELEDDEYVKPVSKCIEQKKMFLYNLSDFLHRYLAESLPAEAAGSRRDINSLTT